jgi:hypothetical protein
MRVASVDADVRASFAFRREFRRLMTYLRIRDERLGAGRAPGGRL